MTGHSSLSAALPSSSAGSLPAPHAQACLPFQWLSALRAPRSTSSPVCCVPQMASLLWGLKWAPSQPLRACQPMSSTSWSPRSKPTAPGSLLCLASLTSTQHWEFLIPRKPVLALPAESLPLARLRQESSDQSPSLPPPRRPPSFLKLLNEQPSTWLEDVNRQFGEKVNANST